MIFWISLPRAAILFFVYLLIPKEYETCPSWAEIKAFTFFFAVSMLFRKKFVERGADGDAPLVESAASKHQKYTTPSLMLKWRK